MWLFEARGFYSIVEYQPQKDVVNEVHKELANSSADPEGWLLVRGRVKEDLEKLEKIAGVDIRITTDPSADYSFRGLITREDFKAYLSKCVDDIDYDSHFKEVTKARASHPEKRYSAMLRIWTAMTDLQPYSPYGTGWRAGSSTGSSYTGWGSVPTSTTQRTLDEILDDLDMEDKTADESYSEYYDRIFHGETGDEPDAEDWSRYQPGRVWDSDRRVWIEPDEWTPSEYWFTTANLAQAWTETPIGEIPDADLEAMEDETFGIWLEALDNYGPMHVLSEEEIESLCGRESSATNEGE